MRKENQKARSTNAKLPKLVSTKFNETYLNWLRFWNQFEAEINRADVATVRKYFNLQELVEPKVRSCIEGLPFSTEGYERAKTILVTKYGDTSEMLFLYNQIYVIGNRYFI